MVKHASFTHWALQPYCIGTKLRALRNHKRLTLARLAAETGLSTALLSKLETERMIPTLPTLATICRVYGVDMSYFFHEPESHILAVTRKAHLEGPSLRADGVRLSPLNAPQQAPRMTAQLLELTGSAYTPEEHGPGLCVFVYVLEGRLHMDVNGLVQTLDQGDCAYLETRMPTNWKAAGDARCRILLVQPGTGEIAASPVEGK